MTCVLVERPLRVLVVDDHFGIRTSIANLIDAEQPRMHCVGTAASADEAIEQVRTKQPDVVVLDVVLAADDGLALMPSLLRAAPCSVVVLTSLLDPRVAVRARQLGACACLQKTAPAAELLHCIELARGATPWAPASA